MPESTDRPRLHCVVTLIRGAVRRPAISGFMVAVSLLIAVAGSSLGTDATDATETSEASADHAVLGRFAIISEAGGAVWAFQPAGELIVTGPGEITSKGSWSAADTERGFDAAIDVTITDQQLSVMGQVSPDGGSIALYVTATEATRPYDWVPWPAESCLTGERFGMVPDATPPPSPPSSPSPPSPPSPPPSDCACPEWVHGVVDWDRCDTT